MSLCLLSRGLQSCGLSKRGFCFHLSKAMISLVFDLAILQSICSTSQPKPQKAPRRQLFLSPGSVAKHSIYQASRRDPNSPSTKHSYGQYLRQTVEASKKHCLSSSTSPVHSANTFTADRLCLVCGANFFASCVVCEQDFCSAHLYACLECNNQYCTRCLDDHRADGHWSDSDTAAELSRGWSKDSVFDVRVGSLALSPLPTGRNVLAITKPCVSVRPARFQGPSDTRQSESSPSHPHRSEPSQPLARQSESSQPHTRESKPLQHRIHPSESSQFHSRGSKPSQSPTRRSETSQRDTPAVITSLLAFLLQAIRQGLSSVDCITVNLLSQSEILLEVSR